MNKYLNKENQIIKYIKKEFKTFRESFDIWIGDDCASFKCDGKLCISTDSYCEKTHFDTKIFPIYYAGYRGLAGALGDLAACGCRPVAFFLSLGLPPKFDEEKFQSLIKGIKDCSKKYNVPLGGGDVVRSKNSIFFTITVVGKPFEKILKRNSLKPGDILYLSSPTGFSDLGFKIIKKRKGKDNLKNLSRAEKAFLMPEINFTLSEFLSKSKSITPSCIDTSDSLIESLLHLSGESGVKLKIMLTDENIPPYLKNLAKKHKINYLDLFLWGGEDYALVFSIPPEYEAKVRRLKGVKPIGKTFKGKGIDVYYNGEKIALNYDRTFKHF